MRITYPDARNLSRYAQAEGAGGAAGPGRPPRATSVESAGGPDGARNTGGAASRNLGGAASRTTGGPATTSSTNDAGPAPA